MTKRQRRALILFVLWIVLTLILSSIFGFIARVYVRSLSVAAAVPDRRIEALRQESDERMSIMAMQIEQMQANKRHEERRRKAVSMVTGWDESISDALVRLSDQYQMPVDHVLGVIKLESKFDPNARGVNTNGTVDHGLMQLNDGGTLQWLGEKVLDDRWADPYDPIKNLQMGMWYLSYQLDQCDGDWWCAKSRYNGDRTGVYASTAQDKIAQVNADLLQAWTQLQ